jgi:hypothetical protein
VDLVEHALHSMPTGMRADAKGVAVRAVAGYNTTETGRQLGISRSQVESVKRELGQAIIVAMTESHSAAEIVRSLGVPTAVVLDAQNGNGNGAQHR